MKTTCVPKVRPWTFGKFVPGAPGTEHNTGYMQRRFAPWPAAHLPYGQTSYTPRTLYEMLGRLATTVMRHMCEERGKNLPFKNAIGAHRIAPSLWRAKKKIEVRDIEGMQ